MRLCIAFFMVLLTTMANSQIDNVGSGRAVTLNGVNEYIKVGNYKDINLPFTISAWIFLDPSLSAPAPIFVTNDNAPTYHGFWFSISAGALLCEFGDGMGENNPAFRRGKVASIGNVLGRWIHVCAVMISPSDISLYINGIDVGGSASGQSSLTMASSYPADAGKIGYFLSNGVSYFFKGSIDEVRLWSRALTVAEVRQDMCKKIAGNESGLAGYWNFNETSGTSVIDNSPKTQNGTFVGGVTRVFSGAPIGDDSKYQYSSNWTGTTLSFQDNSDLVSVNNIQGNPEGIHIYEVKSPPSQTNGLGASSSTQPYFGVFAASLDQDNKFDATYSYQGSHSCTIFSRADNSVASWVSGTNPSVGITMREEILRDNLSGSAAVFDLGPDKTLCNQASNLISTGITDPQFSFSWNTGEATSSITVAQSGKYSVAVTGPCGVVKDSVLINFEPIPPSFDLGSDRILCNQLSTTLSTGSVDPKVFVSWSTGETTSSINVTQPGKYVVKASNDCGIVKDSIVIKFEPIPTAFDLGGDKILCNQSSLTLSTEATDPKLLVSWNTGETTSSVNVSKSGKYVAKVFNDCGIAKDSAVIKFEPIPPSISLGEDKTLCEFKPITLNALTGASTDGYQIVWQDNSFAASFEAKDFGKYWVSVKNDCGATSDTIVFTQYKKQIDFLPNVITPNGDELNQYFKVDEDIKGKVSLLVLNRWGKEVYKSPSYENDWDGGGLSPGEYYIVLKGPCFGEIRDTLTIIH